ncbi:hypothetical protein CIHG_02692 [Coccidioides immitis H538.4]|uniref:Uncharacterized protein n=2 Tax=Coccidioides immitis TaxID=5501 RepID=A0A0J8RLT3_COCIT|nr:hypothetical protein CIRG_03018 [Coccidioides immitis RMSCC 2394]KMU84909.1 hypothetical protein CIHG_02692 [Coccidioides immitis H538.4]
MAVGFRIPETMVSQTSGPPFTSSRGAEQFRFQEVDGKDQEYSDAAGCDAQPAMQHNLSAALHSGRTGCAATSPPSPPCNRERNSQLQPHPPSASTKGVYQIRKFTADCSSVISNPRSLAFSPYSCATQTLVHILIGIHSHTPSVVLPSHFVGLTSWLDPHFVRPTPIPRKQLVAEPVTTVCVA